MLVLNTTSPRVSPCAPTRGAPVMVPSSECQHCFHCACPCLQRRGDARTHPRLDLRHRHPAEARHLNPHAVGAGGHIGQRERRRADVLPSRNARAPAGRDSMHQAPGRRHGRGRRQWRPASRPRSRWAWLRSAQHVAPPREISPCSIVIRTTFSGSSRRVNGVLPRTRHVHTTCGPGRDQRPNGRRCVRRPRCGRRAPLAASASRGAGCFARRGRSGCGLTGALFACRGRVAPARLGLTPLGGARCGRGRRSRRLAGAGASLRAAAALAPVAEDPRSAERQPVQ